MPRISEATSLAFEATKDVVASGVSPEAADLSNLVSPSFDLAREQYLQASLPNETSSDTLAVSSKEALNSQKENILIEGAYPISLQSTPGLLFHSNDGRLEVSYDPSHPSLFEREVSFALKLDDKQEVDLSIRLEPEGRLLIPLDRDPAVHGILLDKATLSMVSQHGENIEIKASREVSLGVSSEPRALMEEYIENDRGRMLLGRELLSFDPSLAMEVSAHDIRLCSSGTVQMHGDGASIVSDNFEYHPLDKGVYFERSQIYSGGAALFSTTVIDTMPDGRGRALDSSPEFPVALVVYHSAQSLDSQERFEKVSGSDLIVSRPDSNGSRRSLHREAFDPIRVSSASGETLALVEEMIPSVDPHRLSELDSYLLLGILESNKEQGRFEGHEKDYERAKKEISNILKEDIEKISVKRSFVIAPDTESLIPRVSLLGVADLEQRRSDALGLDPNGAATGNIKQGANFFFEGARGIGGILTATGSAHLFAQAGISSNDLPTDILIAGKHVFQEDNRGMLRDKSGELQKVNLNSIVAGYKELAAAFEAGQAIELRWREPELANRVLDTLRQDTRSEPKFRADIGHFDLSDDQINALVDFRKSVKLTRNIDQLHLHKAEGSPVAHLSFRVDAVAMDSGIPVLAQGVQVAGAVTQFTIGPVMKGAGELFGALLYPLGIQDGVREVFNTPDKLGRLAAGNGEAWVSVAIDTSKLSVDNWHLFLGKGQFETMLSSLSSKPPLDSSVVRANP